MASIRAKLFAIIAVSLLLVGGGVIFFSDAIFKSLIDSHYLHLYAESLSSIISDTHEKHINTTEGEVTPGKDILTELKEIVYHRSLHGIHPTVFDNNGAIVADSRLPAGDVSLALTPYVMRMVRERNGNFDCRLPNSDSLWVVFRAIPDKKWVVGYVVPHGLKYGEIGKYKRLILAATSIIIVILCGLAFLMVSSITNPINKLVNSAREISAGNIDAEIPAVKYEDLNALSRAFREMRDTMKEKIRGLNRSIEKRDSAERMLRLILDSIPVRVFWKDLDGRFLGCNEAFAKDAGFDSPRDLLGKDDYDLPWKQHAEAYREDDRRIIEDGALKLNVEELLTTSNGNTICLSTSKVPIRNSSDEIIGILGSYSDVTESREAEKIIRNKLNSLTRPLAEVEDMTFEDLFDLDEIQKLQESFSEATGVASMITYPNGKPITRPSNFCRLCDSVIRKTPKGLTNCIKSDAIIGRMNPGGPIVCPCLSGGLWDAGANMIVGGKHVANWLIGQVKNDDLDESHMMDYAKEIGANEDEFKAALAEVTVMSTEQFHSVAQFLYMLANRISEMAFKNVLQARAISAREQAEKVLRENEENLRITLDSIGDAVIATDERGNVIRMNPVAENLSGWKLDDAMGKPLPEVFRIVNAETRKTVENPFDKVMESGDVVGLANHTLLISRDGSERQIADSGAPIKNLSGKVVGVVVVFRDVSEQHNIEEQLRQSQKMDSVGQLAGGVAHDFNNMLSGILGAAELLAERLGDDQKNQRFTKMIIQTAEKAAQLTGKLLVFSRKGSFVSEPTDMHRIVNEAVDIFKHSFDRRISVICHLDAEKPVVLGDPGQLQNAIMNLGINSRDAMPHGGEIVISSHNEVLDDDYCASSQFNLSPGPHLVISVKDNGSGMPKEVISKIFEPFFTTKQQGKGTGLGLAAVYGAIRDHRGAITAYSEVGTGSEFHLYLPIINADDEHASDQSDTINHGGGCVLLVDDEEVIRNTTEAMLESIGYEVMTAADGQEATEIYYKYIHKINVVILDVVMPRMNGEDAFREIRKINPAAKVIISSGFTQDTMIKQLDKEGLNAFIKKPYRKAKLAQTLAEVLAPGNRP